MTPPSSVPQPAAASPVNDCLSPPHNPSRLRFPFWRDAAAALSVAHLCFIQSWYGLLFSREYGYFNQIPVNRASLAALLLNVLGLGVGLWLLSRWVRQANRRWLWAMASLALCLLALIPLNFARTHFWNLTGGNFANLLKQPLVIAIAIALAVLVYRFHRIAAKYLTAVYIILSPMLLFTAGKSAWWMVSPPLAPEARKPTAAQSNPSGTSIIWILLDELDQRIAFDQRPASVAMPELTRFYTENLRATNAYPPGGSTLYSLPALTTGRGIRNATPTSANDLRLDATTHWSDAGNVFSRARALGYSTALVGWYHPYDRVLGQDLDRCAWRPYPPFEEERGFTIGAAMINQICATLSQFQQRRLHIALFRWAEATALDAVTNSPAGLTLLHLPIPHLPGIYDSKHDRLTVRKYARNGEYLANLVLADKLFGRLRQAMERAGTWEKAWVIVSADHWWREAALYDGKRDHRVPFIVKGPGENASKVYANSFSTVATHDLILATLKGELNGAAGVEAWLNEHRSPPPSGYSANGAPF